jgi:hypothetical protein
MSDEGKRATVIGAGIFGCSMAITLSYLGYDVVLVERLPKILYSTTRNNTNRVHLGFHYPRDFATANMCKENFKHFVNFCPEAIVKDFPNAYCIASENSKVSASDYLGFCKSLDLPYEMIDFGTYHTEIRQCDLGLISDEVVVDIDILRNALLEILQKRENIQILCDTEVTTLKKNTFEYELTSLHKDTWRCDIVVNCTYANSNHLTQQLGHDIVKQQFEYTIVPIVELDFPRQGITVMDGPFFGLLPYSKEYGKYTLYHVEHSVIATEVSQILDPNWLQPESAPYSKIDQEALFERLRDACSEFVPALAQAKLSGFLKGPRMVLANHDDDDARPSILHNYGDGYFTVFSGKLDHFFSISESICDALGVSRLQRQIFQCGLLLKNWHNSWKK